VNLLVVGLSHRTAPVGLLERLAVPSAELPDLLAGLLARPYLTEAVVLSTCNRVEVYAAVGAFHGALTEIAAELAGRAGCELDTLADHLYVHYDDEAVRHAFRVAAGLDSMVVGEAQILGQLRDAYGVARDADTPGRLLHELLQQALRVGKRVHSETGIDRAGQNVVTAALDMGVAAVTGRSDRVGGPAPAAGPDSLEGWLAGRRAVVVGAGSMGALAAATLTRHGVAEVTVANRGLDRALRLADRYGARAITLDDLPAALATADLVVSATSSTSQVLTAAAVEAAVAARPVTEPAAVTARSSLLVLDLAVPRDTEPAVAGLPGVELVDIEGLGAALGAGDGDTATALGIESSVRAAEALVAAEVEVFLGFLRSADVAPTVAALRGRAEDVVTAELRRLAQRRPELTDTQRADIARTVHRVVQRLLHQPTVRVRQLAAEPGGDRYTALLRELFGLDPADASAADALRVIPDQRGNSTGPSKERDA
jgi:glutamyl-tRNA reductase